MLRSNRATAPCRVGRARTPGAGGAPCFDANIVGLCPSHVLHVWYIHIFTIWVGGLEHFYFPYNGNNDPNWLIFFIGVETTNQLFTCGWLLGLLINIPAPWSGMALIVTGNILLRCAKTPRGQRLVLLTSSHETHPSGPSYHITHNYPTAKPDEPRSKPLCSC